MSKRHPAWRVVKIALAMALMPLGIVGLFVPILQGFFFLGIAFLLLSSEIPWVARHRAKLGERYLRLFRHAEWHLKENDSRRDEGSGL